MESFVGHLEEIFLTVEVNVSESTYIDDFQNSVSPLGWFLILNDL